MVLCGAEEAPAAGTVGGFLLSKLARSDMSFPGSAPPARMTRAVKYLERSAAVNEVTIIFLKTKKDHKRDRLWS
jgi:hypothetical protein